MPKTTSVIPTDELSVQTREDLVLGVLPDIKKSAIRIMMQHPWCRMGTTLDDLEQEGAVGAMLAAATFDPSKGVKFWSFASRRVTGRMLDLFGRKNYQYLSTMILHGSMHDFDWKLGMHVADPDSLVLQNRLENDSNYRVVHQVMNTLVARERGILRSYFFEDKSYPVIAQTAGVRKSQVCNLQHEALDTIRLRLEGRGFTAGTFFTKGHVQNALCQ
jgi:RNA polymerase sigma factor (sigma-70 family)